VITQDARDNRDALASRQGDRFTQFLEKNLYYEVVPMLVQTHGNIGKCPWQPPRNLLIVSVESLERFLKSLGRAQNNADDRSLIYAGSTFHCNVAGSSESTMNCFISFQPEAAVYFVSPMSSFGSGIDHFGQTQNK
jgi:hypothetical protein